MLPIATWLTVVSLTVSGLLGAVIMEAVGRPLARAAAIWTLRTTEPANPDGSYPWLLVLLFLVMVGWGRWRSVKAPGRQPFVVALVGAIGIAVLPAIYLYLLWGRT